MVAPLILVRAKNGDLHDQESHLQNAAGKRLDDQRAVIPDQNVDIASAAQVVDEAARPKTLAEYNHSDQYYANKSAIRPPNVQRNDFELKPKYFTLVCRIHRILVYPTRILWTIWSGSRNLFLSEKKKRVPKDYLFCKLFKYSLSGEASRWLKQLPPGSLTSWADIKNAFLRNFFDESQTEDLRNNIATSKHIKSSWIRFNTYQRDYPHHRFNEVQLFNIFVRSIALAYQMALDTASEGNFNTRNP